MENAIAVIREAILAKPELVLDDREVMEHLLAAGTGAQSNVVDLRAVLVNRLEGQLGELEQTHRSVLAAAYENIAGTQALHRAVLMLLEPQDFGGFLTVLQQDLAPVLRVDAIRLVIEADEGANALGRFPGLVALPGGSIHNYTAGETRPVILRSVRPAPEVFGPAAETLSSEALMPLDLGEGRRGALLAFAASDPSRFAPDQGTDLLAFFAGVFERTVRRWLG